MKRILFALLSLSLISVSIAAEAPAKKKSAAKAKAEATTDAPSAKAQALSKSLTAAQRTKLLDIINKGDEKTLQTLPGIGETRAVAVKKARPFADPVDLVKVDGVGEGTLEEIVAHAKAGFPEDTKPEPAKIKEEAKKAPAKAKSAAKKKVEEEVTKKLLKK